MIFGCLAASVAVTACHRDVEAIRAAVLAREAGWNRQLATISSEQSALAARFEHRLGAPTAKEGSPRAAQIGAMLAGARQSVIDVAIQVRQVGPRVEQALRHGS